MVQEKIPFSKGLLVLLCAAVLNLRVVAQGNVQVLSVAAAEQTSVQLGSKQILVKGHVWWGKEGSMIYDSHYKAILTLQFSDTFNSKHRWIEVLQASRRSNLATVAGRLHRQANGGLILVADDIQFLESPR